MSKVDLHVHTKYSDGNLSLDEILCLASKLNLDEISITDHDTIINLKNYRDLEKKYNLKINPGVEIPVNYKGMHILGYGITDFEKIENVLYNLKIYNENRNKETIDILQSDGMNITFEDVKKCATTNVVTYRDIVKYIVKMGYVKEPLEVYRKYIGRGTKAYIPSKSLEMEEALTLITEANGFSVLAHPFTLDAETDFYKLIPKMKSLGLSGIEIYQPKLVGKQLELYNDIAEKYKLLRTIGTDFHDSSKDSLGIEVEDGFLDAFHKKLIKK